MGPCWPAKLHDNKQGSEGLLGDEVAYYNLAGLGRLVVGFGSNLSVSASKSFFIFFFISLLFNFILIFTTFLGQPSRDVRDR